MWRCAADEPALPKAPEANPIQISLQKLLGFFRYRERARVFDLIRESVCHELIRKASWAEKTNPQDASADDAPGAVVRHYS